MQKFNASKELISVVKLTYAQICDIRVGLAVEQRDCAKWPEGGISIV